MPIKYSTARRRAQKLKITGATGTTPTGASVVWTFYEHQTAPWAGFESWLRRHQVTQLAMEMDGRVVGMWTFEDEAQPAAAPAATGQDIKRQLDDLYERVNGMWTPDAPPAPRYTAHDIKRQLDDLSERVNNLTSELNTAVASMTAESEAMDERLHKWTEWVQEIVHADGGDESQMVDTMMAGLLGGVIRRVTTPKGEPST